MIFLMEMHILSILGHFRPVFGLLWSHYQFLKLSMNMSDLFLTGLSEIGKTNLDNLDLFDENANIGHFRSVLGLV